MYLTIVNETKKYPVPSDAKSSRCRGEQCGALIYWIPQVKDPSKKFPVNEDGTPHHTTCPNAGDFGRRKHPSGRPGRQGYR